MKADFIALESQLSLVDRQYQYSGATRQILVIKPKGYIFKIGKRKSSLVDYQIEVQKLVSLTQTDQN